MLFTVMDGEFSERVYQMAAPEPTPPVAPAPPEDWEYDDGGYWPYGKEWGIKI